MEMEVLHAGQFLLDFLAYAGCCRRGFTRSVMPQAHKGNFLIAFRNICRIRQGVNLVVITPFLRCLPIVVKVVKLTVLKAFSVLQL